MGTQDFEVMHTALTAWYARGDRAAGGRFARSWLLPRANQIVGAMRTLGDERQDCVQYVVERFLDRLKADGAAARSFAFWTQRIRWYVKDFLRSRGRLPIPTEDAQPPPAANPEQGEERVLAALGARRRARTLAPGLATLGPAQRVYLIVYYHRILGDLLSAEDRAWIAQQSGADPTVVAARFRALDAPDDADAQLTLLFPPDRIAQERARCLDAFRKGRKRAVVRLLATLGAS